MTVLNVVPLISLTVAITSPFLIAGVTLTAVYPGLAASALSNALARVCFALRMAAAYFLVALMSSSSVSFSVLNTLPVDKFAEAILKK